LMQVIAPTARAVARKMGLGHRAYRHPAAERAQAQPDDPGGSTLASLIDDYDGSYVMALAAYNAGPGARETVGPRQRRPAPLECRRDRLDRAHSTRRDAQPIFTVCSRTLQVYPPAPGPPRRSPSAWTKTCGGGAPWRRPDEVRHAGHAGYRRLRLRRVRHALFDYASAPRCKERWAPTGSGCPNLWRRKQVEYTWLRSLMGRHTISARSPARPRLRAECDQAAGSGAARDPHAAISQPRSVSRSDRDAAGGSRTRGCGPPSCRTARRPC